MKILIANSSFHIGGFSSHALNMALAFRALGHSVVAAVEWANGQLERTFREAFDEVFVFNRAWETRTSYLNRIIQLIMATRCNAVINNAVAYVQAALPFLDQRLARLTVLHSIEPLEVLCAASNSNALDAVVAVSPNVAEALEGLVPSSLLHVVPVGVPEPQVMRSLVPPDGIWRLIYVGRITSKAKNLGTLERVLDQLYAVGVQFSMAFVGDGDYLPSLRREIRSRPYASRVRFYGACSPQGIARLLPESDIFLMTSAYEGTPHALLEAMAVGLVPVCSLIPGSTDSIVVNGESGFLCPAFASEAYVLAIKKLAEFPDLYASVSLAARERIKRQFAIKMIVSQYLEILENAVARRGPQTDSRSNKAVRVSAKMKPICPGLPRYIRRRLGNLLRGFRARFQR
ncbi:MAG: glycosyltransferase family 4 protein [Candidatus Omnitrophica bacterium]|nr:glycosyltransferase family 4 protein [Candidatus Omnitrophota bacterium]